MVLLHNDVDIPLADPEKPPAYLNDMKALLRRHQDATVIWAHLGVERVVRPVRHHAQAIEDILKDAGMSHVMFDISWDEVAKYLVASPESLRISVDLLNRYPDRFLFGTDSLAPKDRQMYLKAYNLYGPLWRLLTADAALKIRKTNYERIFDAAKTKVRAWELRQFARSQTTITR